jgi:rhodanese-related sulfurtransferase
MRIPKADVTEILPAWLPRPIDKHWEPGAHSVALEPGATQTPRRTKDVSRTSKLCLNAARPRKGAFMDVSISVEQLKQALASARPPVVVDVRRRQVFVEAGETIAGAIYRDPEQVPEWADSLPPAAAVVVYCVHGHQVSQNVAKALVDRGIAARFLEGGIADWQASGGACTNKPAQPAGQGGG